MNGTFSSSISNGVDASRCSPFYVQYRLPFQLSRHLRSRPLPPRLAHRKTNPLPVVFLHPPLFDHQVKRALVCHLLCTEETDEVVEGGETGGEEGSGSGGEVVGGCEVGEKGGGGRRGSGESSRGRAAGVREEIGKSRAGRGSSRKTIVHSSPIRRRTPQRQSDVSARRQTTTVDRYASYP